MALPATESFTGSAGPVASPPWTRRPITTLAQDGSGLGTNTFSSAADSYALWSADAFPDDQYAECTARYTPANAGDDWIDLYLRATESSGVIQTGYAAFTNGLDSTEFGKYSGGSYTQLAVDNSVTFATGDVVRFTVTGTQVTLEINGTPVLSIADSDWTSGAAGCGVTSVSQHARIDDWVADAAVAGTPGVHVITGRGLFVFDGAPAYLETQLSGALSSRSTGAAEPPNYYHAGMISWGTSHGAMVAYPVTRETDLVAIPTGMTTLWYEFESGINATVTELSAP